MSVYIEPADNISEAWLRTLECVVGDGGHAVNVIATVKDPLAPETDTIRAALDAVMAVPRKKVRVQPVDTVAATIFPHEIYADSGLTFSPGMDDRALAKLNASAADLYECYEEMLPILTTDTANRNGTYFGRMVSWPGKTGGGRNQLADRIKHFRSARSRNISQRNLEDIAIGGEADVVDPPEGLQIYAASDLREYGFPCLVHVDLTLYQNRLSMAATYRHQYLVTKAYGNLLGLSRLLGFLAQQTGYGVGELMVNASFADAEHSNYTKAGVAELIAAARVAQ
ncbi:MAG: hypothetical protein ACJ72L_14095 [Marmoricola sp.]